MSKPRISVNLKVILGIAGIMVSVAIIGGSVFLATQKGTGAYKQVNKTYVQIDQIKELEFSLQNALANQKYYAASGEQEHLDEYKTEINSIKLNTQKLTQLFSGDNQQQDRLSQISQLAKALPLELQYDSLPESTSSAVVAQPKNNQANLVETKSQEIVSLLGQLTDQAQQSLNSGLDQAVQAESNLLGLIILGTLVCSFMAVVTALIVVVYITKPLIRLTKVIESISKGQLDANIDESILNKNDEIGDLAKAFDRTMVSLKLAMKSTGSKPEDQQPEVESQAAEQSTQVLE